MQGQHQAQGSNSHGHHTSSFHPPTPRQQSSEAPAHNPLNPICPLSNYLTLSLLGPDLPVRA